MLKVDGRLRLTRLNMVAWSIYKVKTWLSPTSACRWTSHKWKPSTPSHVKPSSSNFKQLKPIVLVFPFVHSFYAFQPLLFFNHHSPFVYRHKFRLLVWWASFCAHSFSCFALFFKCFSLMPLPFTWPTTFISLTFMGLAIFLANV